MTRLHIAVALLSLSLIGFQLALMQIFSIVQWYHFAFMVISIALLGFGASGTVLSLAREWLVAREELLLSLLMILSGISMSSVLAVTQTGWFRFDSFLLFVESRQVYALLITYLILSIPFLLGALALGLVFLCRTSEIGNLYCANLLGSGIGGLAAVMLLWIVPASQMPALLALFPVVAGVLVLPKAQRTLVLSLGLFGLFMVAYFIVLPSQLVPSEYKSLSRAMDLPDAEIVFERSGPYGLVQIVSSPALRYAPGLSLAYQKPVPVRQAVFNNGDWFGPIVGWSRSDSSHLLDYTTITLPYVIRQCDRVLVLQAGTGMLVSHAISRRAKSVVAVEPHTTALSALQCEMAATIDSLFTHPSLSVYNTDPRSFLTIDSSRYDLILLPTIDAFGGTTGLYALQEQYMLTKEAFQAMWERLTPDGIVCVSSWMDHPFRNPLKILATLAEVLEEEGVMKPAENIVAVRSWGMITYAIKRSRLNEDEIKRVRAFSTSMLFDPALMPGIRADERSQYNQMADQMFFRYLDEIVSPNRAALYKAYDFNISPSTDDRPYFSQFLRWKSVPHLREIFGGHTFPFLEIGTLIVVVTFLQCIVVAGILILVPFSRMLRSVGRKRWTLVYFSALGVGFMCIEIAFIQRFILYLGHPVFAAAAVISAMLICSGVGSLLSQRFPPRASILMWAAGLVAAVIIGYALILTPVLRLTISLPLPIKAVFSLLLIAPAALAMGMPFPLGFRYLAARAESQVAWAWGINGCASVVSTSFAVLLAVEAGVQVVMLLSASMYVLAAVVTRFER